MTDALPSDLDLGRRYLKDHPPPGRVLLCAVSGVHLYGYPSADSDLELKGIHLAPTRSLLGLASRSDAHEIASVLDGVRCELATNEAAIALSLLLAGNGNMLERILSPWQVLRTPELGDLQTFARGAISRRFARHYGAWFRTCIRAHERAPTARTMLSTYRAALTGAHLLHTGRLESNVAVLAPYYGFADVADLIEAKRSGAEQQGLPASVDGHHRAGWPRLSDLMAQAEADTALPAEPDNRTLIEEWMLDRRIADLGPR